MNPIQELKNIAHNQKTVSTTRLLGYISKIENVYIQQSLKISGQSKH